MEMDSAPADRPQDRQDSILDAAFHAFATYGYRRASMDDIARGAGLSRTALYLHYRNKEDIFRSLATRYFDEAMAAMRAALDRPGLSRAEALAQAMAAKDGKFMEAVLTTPHGQELLDAGFAITGDIAAAGEGRMAALLADWLARQGAPDDIGGPDGLAALMLATLKGLKAQGLTMAEYRAAQGRLARMVARALD